jgi:hypothetical protein
MSTAWRSPRMAGRSRPLVASGSMAFPGIPEPVGIFRLRRGLSPHF